MRDWWTALDLAEQKLPGMPATERAIQLLADRKSWRQPRGEWPSNPKGWWRKREGRGGGFEYRCAILPMNAQTALAMREARKSAPQPVESGTAWEWWDRQTQKKKDEAKRRFDALDAVDTLFREGMQPDMAMMMVANRSGVALRTLYNWKALTYGLRRADWLPALTPRQRGRETLTAECPFQAFEDLKKDYLRLEQPSFQSCYRRLEMAAPAQGWTLPSARTLERRLTAEIPPAVMILAREGEEALKRKFPAQRRERHGFHAMEAVNADGHKFDVFVRTPAGKIVRPVMLAFQDLHSGKILSWRLDETEHRGSVLLAFGDLVEAYGVPDHCWLDNGRGFASKWVTGGIPNRFRFKVKQDDIPGVMTSLNVEVHWTQPYSGQSKPIERAFRDLADNIAKHPRFAGAYTGNSPDAKPENYGSRAVDWDVFEATVAEGVAEHNARKGRRSAVCQGRYSFDEVFKASYEHPQTIIRKTSEAQRRLWLLAVEGVTVRSDQTMIHLFGNRYWAEFLIGLSGQKVAVRFDPEALHEPLHVYALDGSYLGAADCVDNAGFADQAAARAHTRARRDWLRAQQTQLDAERRMGLVDRATPIPDIAPEAPAAQVVRPVFGNLALKSEPRADAREDALKAFELGVDVLYPAWPKPSP